MTRYDDVVNVLRDCSTKRTPTPEQLTEMGLVEITPIARVMVKQMLFMDAPAIHSSHAGVWRSPLFVHKSPTTHLQDIAERLLDDAQKADRMDVIADFAAPSLR